MGEESKWDDGEERPRGSGRGGEPLWAAPQPFPVTPTGKSTSPDEKAGAHEHPLRPQLLVAELGWETGVSDSRLELFPPTALEPLWA